MPADNNTSSFLYFLLSPLLIYFHVLLADQASKSGIYNTDCAVF